MKPIELTPNQPRHFYRGGAAIREFRGIGGAGADDHRPEDWLASINTVYRRDTDGLTRLPDGRFLRDAVNDDPESWLGPEHVARFGADTGLLVKLLDAGERLPVHYHPTIAFARQHLGCIHGKTEAWIILSASGEDSVVYLGFRDEKNPAEVAEMIATQDRSALVAALNVVRVRPGDAVLVPAGVPHAIGVGVFLIELQEPTDLSVLIERSGFDLEGVTVDLGLGDELALSCLDRSAWDAERLDRVHIRREGIAPGESLLPPMAEPFFRAESWQIDRESELDAGFSVLVVVRGDGALRAGDAELPLARGTTILVPHAAGASMLTGALNLVRCRPPVPEAVGEEQR